MERYKVLQAEVKQLQAQNRLPTSPTIDQQVDWAYGNAAMENPNVTMEIVREAMHRLEAQKSGK
jgi:hypothetical protein